MTNFGVELFLRTFLEYARVPMGRHAVVEAEGAVFNGGGQDSVPGETVINPDNDEFSGFVFKLQVCV